MIDTAGRYINYNNLCDNCYTRSDTTGGHLYKMWLNNDEHVFCSQECKEKFLKRLEKIKENETEYF